MAELSFSSSFRQRQNISRRGFCLCTWFPTCEHNCILKGINRSIQMKCQRSRTGQCESWMSVWVPSASHSGPLGQGARGCSWRLLMTPFSVFLWTWPGKDGDVRKPCQLAQNLPWSVYSDCKSSMGKDRWVMVGKSVVGGSRFEAQQSHSLCVLVSYSGPQFPLL